MNEHLRDLMELIAKWAANNRLVVVSLPSWGWKGTLANFSFQYLILVIVVSLTIIYHAVHYRMSSQRLTYATKIQVMLNAAFILPLLIVLFFILKIPTISNLSNLF